MSIIINNLSYLHPDKEVLFENFNFSIPTGSKIALIGKNGSGKSTLLRIISGSLAPSSGEIVYSAIPHYIPQHFGQYNDQTVAEVLGVEQKMDALHAILAGDTDERYFNELNDDWTIEERVHKAFDTWLITHINLSDPMDKLSGGEKTKIFLAGIEIHTPSIILLDEPSNHLDYEGRQKLYDLIRSSKATILMVSHDRALLNMVTTIYELEKGEVITYGGNYEFYKVQKEENIEALQHKIEEKEKSLRKAKKTNQQMAERKQKLDARGKNKQTGSGIPRIMMNTLRNEAENSAAKVKESHAEKINTLNKDLKELRENAFDMQQLKVYLKNTALHVGKVIIDAQNINYRFDEKMIWETPLSFQIVSGDRFQITGKNGAGKTTLIRLILDQLQPTDGVLKRVSVNSLYIDQEYSLINPEKTVVEQLEQFNDHHLEEHELRVRLHHFLFPADTWNKPCAQLSGGEKMKLLFCCLSMKENMPDLLILDEPTNNLDIQSLDIITQVVKNYQGTVLVVSHDRYFIEEIEVTKTIAL